MGKFNYLGSLVSPDDRTPVEASSFMHDARLALINLGNL